ncbi:hypothetical protein GM1_043_00200 [Gordonia malaquae NBRC 108250]|uniref:Uncharacterized protein n=1 Tax=Gordonia malaquae NBRC 108250 TaxID=1223542 RepID=M3V064_GORML|nr:hypothetical protein GM1_043_00200 [Gordonia malaquae NBRC 108250]
MSVPRPDAALVKRRSSIIGSTAAHDIPSDLMGIPMIDAATSGRDRGPTTADPSAPTPTKVEYTARWLTPEGAATASNDVVAKPSPRNSSDADSTINFMVRSWASARVNRCAHIDVRTIYSANSNTVRI